MTYFVSGGTKNLHSYELMISVQMMLIGRMFAGDAVLLVDVQCVLAGPGSLPQDSRRETVLQDSRSR